MCIHTQIVVDFSQSNKLELKKGDFVILFPEDTHVPLCNLKPVKKCVVKIPKKYLLGD